MRCEFSTVDTFSGAEQFAWCAPCGWFGPYRYSVEGTARDFTIHAGWCPLCSDDPRDIGGGHRGIDPLRCDLVLSDLRVSPERNEVR